MRSTDYQGAVPTVSTYSFETHSRSAAIKVLDIQTGNSTTLLEDQSYSEPTWLDDSDFLVARSGEKGTTSLLVANATVPGSECVPVPSRSLGLRSTAVQKTT